MNVIPEIILTIGTLVLGMLTWFGWRIITEESECDDRNIDEQCGHDWGKIEDETEDEE